MERTDIRMDYLKNVISNLKYIKARALEMFYLEKLFQKREEEIKKLYA